MLDCVTWVVVQVRCKFALRVMLHVDAHGAHDGQALQEAERWGLYAVARPE